MSRHGMDPSEGRSWRDVNLIESEDENEISVAAKNQAGHEPMDQSVSSLGQQDRDDRTSKRALSLPEYEPSHESDLNTQSLTGAMLNLSMGPCGSLPKRPKVEDVSNVGVKIMGKAGEQSTGTLLDTSVPQNHMDKGADRDSTATPLLQATGEFAGDSYGQIAETSNAEAVDISLNHVVGSNGDGAGEKLIVEKKLNEASSAELVLSGAQVSTLRVEAGMVTYGDLVARDIYVNMAPSSSSSSHQQSTTTSFCTAEAPIQSFEGRQNLLKTIQDKLQERLCQDHHMRRIVALVAMGGMGKSETARKLAHDYRKFYNSVAWIDAETEQSTKESFIKIATILKLPHSDLTPGKRLAELVYHCLSSDRPNTEQVEKPNLFIFDNAIKLQSEGNVFGIFDYLPRQMLDNRPVILLTSQSTEWQIYECEVLKVTELSRSESLNFLYSRFKLDPETLTWDGSLRGLLDDLVERLNGYPLALGLAAANISIIPGQGSVELLQQSLKRYIQLVDKNKILEQRVNAKLDTDYPHTLLKVFDIAMTNLERREHARGAKHLLSMLAYVPQSKLMEHRVRRMYEATSDVLGVSFPQENDATFEEAHHELQTVGLTVVEKRDWGVLGLKVHRLVQTLARLGPDVNFGIEKLIVHNITDTFDDRVDLALDCLMEKEGIPGWAIDNEWKTLLWLHGLRFVQQREGCTTVALVSENELMWKKQLAKFKHGGDMAVVATFIVNNGYSKHRPDWNSDLLWTLIGDATKAKALLVESSTRVLFEHLLLTVVAQAADTLFNRFCEASLRKLFSCPDADVLDDFKAWIFSFDFSTVIASFPTFKVQIVWSVVWSLVKVSRIVALAFPKFRLVEPTVLFRLADAASTLLDNQNEICSSLVRDLAVILNPEEGAELVRDFDLLGHLSTALKLKDTVSVFRALGIIRQLVWKSNCAPNVLEYDGLLENLSSCTKWNAYVSPLLPFKRYRVSMHIRGRFPGAMEGAMEPKFEDARHVSIIYRAMIVSFAIYTSLPPNACMSEGILAKLLPLNFCQGVGSWLANFDFSPTRLHVVDGEWKDTYRLEEPFLSMAELKEDMDVLTCTARKLENEAAELHEGGWGHLMLQLVEHVGKLNGNFLHVMVGAEESDQIFSFRQSKWARTTGEPMDDNVLLLPSGSSTSESK